MNTNPGLQPNPADPENPTGETDILDIEYILYQASGGKRFANYLIDRFTYYVIWQFITLSVGVEAIRYLILIFHNPFGVAAIWFGFSALTFVLVIAGVETLTGGKTLGKLATRTRAVNVDGTRISGKTALLRCLSRLVPFEAFSALGRPSYPWHDRWTKTVVIDEQTTTLPPWD